MRNRMCFIGRRAVRVLSLTLALIVTAGGAKAQSVQVSLDKKVVMTDSLNLPRNVSAYMILTILPELLQRPDVSMYSNYDVQVNGMSVSEVSDVALMQLHLQDIEKIEISESPIASYQKNGVGGCINIVLRDRADEQKKVWGSASVDVEYPMLIAPQLLIGNCSKRMKVHGLLLSEAYKNGSTNETRTYSNGALSSWLYNDYELKYHAQLARAYMLFSLSERDELKVNLSELYSSNKTTDTPELDASLANKEKLRTSHLQTQVNYKHTFSRAALQAEVQHVYNPGYKEMAYPAKQNYDNHTTNHQVAGKVELKADLLPVGQPSTLKLGVGGNVNGTFKSEDINSHLLNVASSQPLHIAPETNTFFAQPYLFLETNVGRLKAKATGELQHIEYDMQKRDVTHLAKSNDFTGQLIAEWHFTPHHNLRMIVDRKLQRPSDEQLFPERMYSLERMNYVQGNPDLTPVLSHEAKLNYIADHRWNDHSLLFDVSTSYNHVSDIIGGVTMGRSSGGSSGGGILGGPIGATLQYLTFANNGSNNILNENMMLMYSYRTLSVSLTGNVYHNEQEFGPTSNHYTYYNISLNPHFNLKDGWHGSASITYHSKVKRADSELSDCTISSMSVGKRWNNLFVYCFNKMSLQKKATDITYGAAGERVKRTREMMPDVVGMGVKYDF